MSFFSLSSIKKNWEKDLKTNRRNSCDPVATAARGWKKEPIFFLYKSVHEAGATERNKYEKQYPEKGILNEAVGLKKCFI